MQGMSAAAGETPRHTALIVDDSRTGRRIVTTLLTFLGFCVVEAVNGTEALSALEGRAFDLITIDRNLEGEDGVDLVRQLRAHPLCGEEPRIMALTGHVGREHSNAFFEAGADAYLAKPFTVRELSEIVTALGFDTVLNGAPQIDAA